MMSSFRTAIVVLVATLAYASGTPLMTKNYIDSPLLPNVGQSQAGKGDPCQGGAMFHGQCYDFTSKKTTWEEARYHCTNDLHGDLPIVKKRPVYDTILKYAKNTHKEVDDQKRDAVAWLGLKASKVPGVLIWVNQDIQDHTNNGVWNIYEEWDESNPGQKDKPPIGCIGVNLRTGKFRSYDCDDHHLVVCELNFQRDGNILMKINEKIDGHNRAVKLEEQGTFASLVNIDKGVKNLYETDIQLDEEQRELINVGADPSSATGEIRIKAGKTPTHEELERIYKIKNEGNEAGKSRKKRSAIEKSRYRWPQGIVPYVFDPLTSSSAKKKIMRAMTVFNERTCVKLIPRNTETDYIFIRATRIGNGCWSYVGRDGGKQIVNLSIYGCLKEGTIQHELMHAFGYWHEHSRPDRDDWVVINWNNIESGKSHNFAKKPRSVINGFKYDYASVMQYPKWMFARYSNLDTITPLKQTKQPLGDAVRVTDWDLAELNYLYGCGTNSSHGAQESVAPGVKESVASSIWTLNKDKTSGGNSNSAPCVFPFIAWNKQHNDCVKHYDVLKACATTANYTADKKWGVCVYNKLVTTRKGTGNDGGTDCHFPFTAYGKIFHFCTMIERDTAWCSTTSNFDKDRKWAQCVLDKQDGGLTEWSVWGTCTGLCPNRYKIRTRECTNPKPANGGLDCSSPLSEVHSCSDCTRVRRDVRHRRSVASRAVATEYQWLGCWDDAGLPEAMNTIEGTPPATGDYTERLDKKATCAAAAKAAGCIIFALRFDGKCYGQTSSESPRLYQGNGPSDDCPTSGHGSTDALDAYTTDVNAPIAGQWGEWSTYGKCSKTCGGGGHTRTRTCNNPVPKNGGDACPGNAEEVKTCAADLCPVDGNWDQWTNWSSGIENEETSDIKYRYRRRECTNPPPSHGGAQCQGEAVDVKKVG